jgi:thiol-disulfide isomerase/thioredoxin
MNPSSDTSSPLLWGGLLVLLVVVAVLWWKGPDFLGADHPVMPSDKKEIPILGRPAPAWTLRALDGKLVTLGDFRGRVLFLNIWATWCPPCVAEIPDIQKLHDSLKDEGVAFVLASAEGRERVRTFVERRQWHVPVYTYEDDPPGLLASDSIPATFILNPKGEIVFKHIGGANWDNEDCRRFLRRLRETDRNALRP